MKKRSDSFFGIHFDFHANPDNQTIGLTLDEEDIREICRTLKPDFIQIDCKGHPGIASYPTKLGNAAPSFSQDPLKLWRKVTKEEDVALYMHYSGIYDVKYCETHPEECQVGIDGTPRVGFVRPNGKYVDDLLIPQLTELAEAYGVDGVWVDGDCWATSPDYHPDTVAAFEKETGIALNGKLPERGDPYFDEYREYCRELFRRYVRRYVDAIHKKHPDFQIASNWSYTDHMPEAISSEVDFISGDLNPQNSFYSARYAGRAIAQQNYTWDLMSWNFRIGVHENGAPPKHPSQILQEAADVISLGGGFQNYVPQFRDGSPMLNQIRPLKALAEFMRQRQDCCFRVKPVHQVALLLSTYDRHRESNRLYSRTGYEKVMGLCALLCDAGHSLEIVSEHTLLGHCADYPLIIIPELYAGLDREMLRQLLAYAENGGSLLLVGKHTCEIFEKAGAPFRTIDLKQYEGVSKVYENGHGKQQENGKPQAYFFTIDGERYGSLIYPCGLTSEGEAVAYIGDTQRERNHHIATVIPYGKGRVSSVGFDLGRQYLEGAQYLHRTLIRDLADRLYTPIVKLESACGLVEILLTKRDGRTLIQLINANGDHTNRSVATCDFLPPVLDIKLSIATDQIPKALILHPTQKVLDFEYRDGRVTVELDRLDIHGTIEILR